MSGSAACGRLARVVGWFVLKPLRCGACSRVQRRKGHARPQNGCVGASDGAGLGLGGIE